MQAPMLPPSGVVTELQPYDVLFGRGSGPNDHEGNIRFREIVKERKDEYLATNHRQTKARIAREVVDAVITKNGRFLKRMEPEDAQRLGIPESVDAWVVVEDSTVMEKAKQALRQNRDKDKAKSTESNNNRPKASPSSPKPDSAKSPSPLPVSSHSPVPSSTAKPIPKELLDPLPLPVNPQVFTTAEMPVPYAAQSELTKVIPAAAAPPMTGDPDLEPVPLNWGEPPLARTQPSANVSRGVMRDNSIQIKDLMSSFGQMKTSDMQSVQSMGFGESCETMGTIDPIDVPEGGNLSAMSLASFSSSTGSFLKSALSPDDERMAQAQDSLRFGGLRANSGGSGSARNSFLNRDVSRRTNWLNMHNSSAQRGSILNESMALSEIFNSRRGSSMGMLPPDQNFAVAEAENEDDAEAELRPIDLVEADSQVMGQLGSSSLSMMRSALFSSGGISTSDLADPGGFQRPGENQSSQKR